VVGRRLQIISPTHRASQRDGRRVEPHAETHLSRGSTRVYAGHRADTGNTGVVTAIGCRTEVVGSRLERWVVRTTRSHHTRDAYGVVTTPGVRSLKYTPMIGVSVIPTV
jgi:hypothetical protein